MIEFVLRLLFIFGANGVLLLSAVTGLYMHRETINEMFSGGSEREKLGSLEYVMKELMNVVTLVSTWMVVWVMIHTNTWALHTAWPVMAVFSLLCQAAMGWRATINKDLIVAESGGPADSRRYSRGILWSNTWARNNLGLLAESNDVDFFLIILMSFGLASIYPYTVVIPVFYTVGFLVNIYDLGYDLVVGEGRRLLSFFYDIYNVIMHSRYGNNLYASRFHALNGMWREMTWQKYTDWISVSRFGLSIWAIQSASGYLFTNVLWRILSTNLSGIWRILRVVFIHKEMLRSAIKLLKTWRVYFPALVIFSQRLLNDEATGRITRKVESALPMLGLDPNKPELVEKFEDVWDRFMKMVFAFSIVSVVGELSGYLIPSLRMVVSVSNHIMLAHIAMTVIDVGCLYAAEKMRATGRFSETMCQAVEDACNLSWLGYTFVGLKFNKVVFVDHASTRRLNEFFSKVLRVTGLSAGTSFIGGIFSGIRSMVNWGWRYSGLSWVFSALRAILSYIYLDKVIGWFMATPLYLLQQSHSLFSGLTWNAMVGVVMSGLLSYALLGLWRMLKPRLLGLYGFCSSGVNVVYQKTGKLSEIVLWAVSLVLTVSLLGTMVIKFMQFMVPMAWPLKLTVMGGYAMALIGLSVYSGNLDFDSISRWHETDKVVNIVLMVMIKVAMAIVLPVAWQVKLIVGLSFCTLAMSDRDKLEIWSVVFCTCASMILATRIMMEFMLPMPGLAQLILVLWHTAIIGTCAVFTRHGSGMFIEAIDELLSEEKNGGKQNGAPLTGNGPDSVPSAPPKPNATGNGSGSVPSAPLMSSTTGNGSDPVPSAPLMSSTTEGGSGSVPIATSINQGATDGSDSIPVAQPIGERGSFARVSP
ncbi:MAG: hypothetical protein VX737_00210 [Pseudomonadota bacterium]|nr:hypothetical protein [Pseudomonadota bacterium]